MSNKEKAPKAPKEPKAPKTKKNFFDKAWDFLGAVGRKPWFRICEIVVATLLVVLLIFYCAAMLFAEKSGFSIAIKDDKNTKAAISLSESEDFSNPTVRLNAGGIENVTNMSVVELPESFDSKGGSHNGENYLAYTFYLKNAGSEAADIRSELNIKSVLKNVDAAMRVRVYKNGDHKTYAKLDKNGEPIYNTTPFADEKQIFSVVEENVQPNEIIKYTFVVWLEGDDDECQNDIKGGSVEMSWTFSLENAET